MPVDSAPLLFFSTPTHRAMPSLRRLVAPRCVIAALLLALVPSVTRGQELASTTLDTRIRLDLLTTERSRFSRGSAQSLVGTFAGVRSDTVLLIVRPGVDPIRVPIASMRSSYVSRGRPQRWEAAIRGAVAPALIGAALSAITASIRRESGDPTVARAAMTSAAWGAASGAVLGAWSPKERWRRVTMPTPGLPEAVVSNAGSRPASDSSRTP